MSDHNLVRWQRDRPLRRVAILLCAIFAVVALLPPVNQGGVLTDAGELLALTCVAAAIGLLGLIGLWRSRQGIGYFVFSVMLVTFPVVFVYSTMVESKLRSAILVFVLLDLLFNAFIPPGLLLQLLWGMWQQLRQTVSD